MFISHKNAVRAFASVNRVIAVAALTFTQAITNTAAAAELVSEFDVRSWVSTELHPMDSRWYTDPWPESAIPRRLEPQPSLLLTQPGTNTDNAIVIDPYTRFQTIRGLGTSLEHTTVYAIRKNKTPEQQKAILTELIDPVNGIGMNLFRVSIGTSDFADGTRATPQPDNPKGWYSYQDTPTSAFSIARDKSLGIIETVKMAAEVGEAASNPIKFVASAWSPPRWMRERNNMVQGGPLLEDQYNAYAAYLRQFVEAYQAEGIPIYALTMQNERQFEPGAYPGMVMTWQEEQKLLLAVYENFHNISGDHGAELDVKLWTLDHNFSYWQQAEAQIDSLKMLGKQDYLDATAFHHYEGNPENMSMLHMAHPDKDVIFTEGSLWGLSGDNNKRSFETLIRHFRNWSTGYIAWVTMTTQTLDEANQGPYNGLGIFDPTMLVKNDGDNPDWYKTPEYWLMGQFSKFIQPGAVRIQSDYGSLQRLTNVAFLNPDNTVVMVVANSSSREQTLIALVEGNQITGKVPARSIATYQWKLGVGQSPHAWQPLPEPEQLPFQNNTAVIPGVVQLENYDTGGFDVSYFDTSDGNTGGDYRSDDVDIEETESGVHVGWVQPGEWLEYTVNIQSTGTFRLLMNSAADGEGGSFSVWLDGEPVFTDIQVNDTSGWTTFVESVHAGTATLEKGERLLRVEIDSGEFNLDYLKFELVDNMMPVDPDPVDPVDSGSGTTAGALGYVWMLILLFYRRRLKC